ncbi:MAG: hypothetical protein IKY43_03630 [Bacteroidales bacterium]|nr:hypothetical protein [Bacteroidales bacterium]
MKIQYLKIAALSIVLGSMAVSCQKDYSLENNEICQKNLANVNPSIHYSVDGQVYQQTFGSEEEYDMIITYLIGLAREGHLINIKGNDNPEYAPAKTQTFKTANEAEMKEWVKKKRLEGYNVRFYFDEGSGLYTGTATPPGGGSRTTMAANLSQERE